MKPHMADSLSIVETDISICKLLEADDQASHGHSDTVFQSTILCCRQQTERVRVSGESRDRICGMALVPNQYSEVPSYEMAHSRRSTSNLCGEGCVCEVNLASRCSFASTRISAPSLALYSHCLDCVDGRSSRSRDCLFLFSRERENCQHVSIHRKRTESTRSSMVN